jgi:hypothetical protein
VKRPADGPKTLTTARIAQRKKAKVVQLRPSQLEAITGDVDIESLKLALHGFASEQIIERVTAADIERTIEGASTFTVKTMDDTLDLIRSPYLHHKSDIELDGLWFRLVGVDGEVGGNLTVGFEDREVAVLRKYNKPKSAAWGTTTRPKFIKDMIREVKPELNIPFICPEIGEVKVIGKSTNPKDLAEQRDVNRQPGFSFGTSTKVTVKNVPADEQQLNNISRVLNVGIGRKVRRKLLVCAIMTITVESVARNLQGGDRDSAGLFQQRPSQGWGSYAEVITQEHAANKFYDQAIAYDAEHPLAGYGEVCQAVQRSAFPGAYDLWRTEAERTVKLYGVPGGDTSTVGDVAQESNLELISTQDGIFLGTSAGAQEEFQFTRGNFTKTTAGKRKVERENTWDCTGRLADEVQWRRFVVSGSFYYMSEHYMWRSRPRAHVSVDDEYHAALPAVSYDIGQKNATITLAVFADRWAVPPGSVVMLDEDFGSLLQGRWLVSKISRSLFSPVASIILVKPRPQLPEPKQTTGTPFSLAGATVPTTKAKTPGMVGGYVAPLATDGHLERSEFSQADPEGAPDNLGITHHAGKDWFAPGGTAVVAPIDGTIVELRPATGYSGQVFGGTVKVQQANGYVWVFRHTDPVMALRVGAKVQQGEKVAAVARWADNPSSSHCHIEVWKTFAGGYDYENMLDPVKVLKGES